MKRILVLAGALLMAACTAVPALAGPHSIVFTQRNAADTGNVLYTPQQPAVDSVVFFNTATNRANYLTLGPGLAISGGALHASVPNGPQGPVGPAGPAGADGAPGASGADGAQGIPGPPGATGAAGPTGATGPQGIQGIQGVAGPAGTPAPTFNFGLPVARTLAVTTPYQATNPAKPAIVTVSPSCSASLTLAGGTT